MLTPSSLATLSTLTPSPPPHRLFTLDMLLGNADRLACESLGWRGNSGNLLHARAPSRWAGRAVPIDAVVQRRPPGGLLSVEASGLGVVCA